MDVNAQGSATVDRSKSLLEAEELREELNRVVSALENTVHEAKIEDGLRPSSSSSYYDDQEIAQAEQQAYQVIESVERVALLGCSTGASTNTEFYACSQEELQVARAENTRLRLRVQQLESALARFKSSAQGFKEERDRLKRKVRELQSSRLHQCGYRTEHGAPGEGSYVESGVSSVRGFESFVPPSAVQKSASTDKFEFECKPGSPRISPPFTRRSLGSLDGLSGRSTASVSGTLVTKTSLKMAEKVRLKRNSDMAPEGAVFGSEISSLGVSSTKVAEHLVGEIQEESLLQESMHSLDSDAKMRAIELEFEKLRAKTEHMQSQVSLLEMSLSESRSCSDYLSTLCAQLEANQTAFHLALNYANQMEEVQEKLVELVLNSDHGLEAAKRLVEKLENESNNKISSESGCCRNFGNRNRMKILDEGFSSSGGVVSGSSSEDLRSTDSPAPELWLEKELVERLKEQARRLKVAKNAVLSTLVALDPFYSEPPGLLTPSSAPPVLTGTSGSGTTSQSAFPPGTSCIQQERMDLENAVLIQELTASKEEKADLKAQLYLMERDKESVELALHGKLAELQAARIQVQQLTHDLHSFKEKSEEKSGLKTEVERKLEEERDMRMRLADLADALQTVTENAELRARQSDCFIADLRHANSALLAAFDRSKRRHLAKVTRLQEQMRVMRERYDAQLRILKQQKELA